MAPPPRLNWSRPWRRSSGRGTDPGSSTTVRRFQLEAILEAHLKRLKAQSLKRGWSYRPDSLLFPSSAGTVLDYANSAKVFGRILAQAKLRHRSPYTLRDTFISQHLSRGQPPLWVAEQVGDRPDMVLKYYAKWLPKDGQRYSLASVETPERERKGAER